MESTRKDTQNTWIGKIPDSWTLKRLKYHFTIIGGNGFSPEYQGNEYGDYPFFKAGDISQAYAFGQNISTSPNWVTRELATIERYNIIPAKSILLPKIGEAMRKNSRAITSIDCCVDNNCQALVPQNIDIYYAYYLLRCIDMRWFENYGPVPSLNNQKLLNTFIPYPPLEVQEQIGKWLNKKCAELDSLSSDIQKEVETLEAYKRSLITEAVTKGLNKSVPMKDSDIPWVGKIPASWNVKPLFLVAQERKNPNRLLLEHNLLSLSYGRIVQKDINTNEGLLPASFSTYNIIEKNDIVIRPTDLQNDKKSLRTGFSTMHGIITSAYITLKIKEGVPQYFHYLLHSYDLKKVFYNMGNGVRQGLNYSEFCKLMVIIPSEPEQLLITRYLNSKCSEIDSIIFSKKQQLETLTTYKKSLIYEYVTGKKEVK